MPALNQQYGYYGDPLVGHHETYHLHPRVLKVIGLATLWSIIMTWAFFRAGDYDVAPGVVTGIGLVAFMLPASWWLIRSLYRDRRVTQRPWNAETDPKSFHDWSESELAIEGEHLKGSEAMVNLLLPVMAAPLLMTIFVIIARLAMSGAPAGQ